MLSMHDLLADFNIGMCQTGCIMCTKVLLEIPSWKVSARLIIQKHIISPFLLRLCDDYECFVIYFPEVLFNYQTSPCLYVYLFFWQLALFCSNLPALLELVKQHC